MKKTTSRKIRLVKDTVRLLQPADLQGVNGGRQPTSTNPCMSLSVCPTCAW